MPTMADNLRIVCIFVTFLFFEYGYGQGLPVAQENLQMARRGQLANEVIRDDGVINRFQNAEKLRDLPKKFGVPESLRDSAGKLGANVNMMRAQSSYPIKLTDQPECAEDIKAICPEASRRNNFAVLDCLENEMKSDMTLAAACQHTIWKYKRNLTMDARFDSAASQVCQREFLKFDDCNELDKGTGFRLSCLLEHKKNVTSLGCRQFLTKMESIVFSDYRLVFNFMNKCQNDIEAQGCGRVVDEEDSPHTQGSTIECLEKNVEKLGEECKLEILRVAELQSDDFHLNRPLYYACRDDREKFCHDIKAGSGAVLKCLTKNKFQRTMSDECRSKLTGVQKLMEKDVKVNRPLFEACKSFIFKNNCIKDGSPPNTHEARQSRIILCLESVIADDRSKVDGKCRAEVRDTRRAIMEDYKVSPDLVYACDTDIVSLCGGGLHRGGQTLHCLMEQARRGKLQNDECEREVEKLVEEVNPAEDISLDPTLYSACKPMISKCKDNNKDQSDMMSCLLDNIDSDDMPEECERRILEVQFFISRNFKLDPRLYKMCHEDAAKYCHAGRKWDRTGDTTPNVGPTVFACLYKHFKFHETDKNQQLQRACAFEVRRTLRQRAVSVELNPRIQEPCIYDIQYYCDKKTGRGEELRCLQDNYETLEEECKLAIGNFTQDQDKDVQMDKLLMKACTPMIKSFCKDLLNSANTQPGDVMQCLIKNKMDSDMDRKCRSGIEHHQLISLKDYKFTFKFKEACKNDVISLCKHRSKSKSDVVVCLSETIRNDTLKEVTPQRVSAECRKQVTFELLQRSENIHLDPKLEAACSRDISDHCGNVSPGGGAVLQCLQKAGPKLSSECKALVFKREEVEVVNVKNDYPLFMQCKRMIKTHCSEVKPSDIFSCLKEHKGDDDFDKQCKKMLLERMRERAKDIKLNPKLQEACSEDVAKFCSNELTEKQQTGSLFEAKVMICLRIHYSRKRLSETCEAMIGKKVKESALDYKQNPALARACSAEIKEFCMTAVNSQDLDDHGQVEECLKHQLSARKITARPCVDQIVQIIRESTVDVHVDPLLYKACSVDLTHVCQGVPRGDGRQMSCLLHALDDRKVKLTVSCRKMMEDRRQLWENAADIAPFDSFNDLMAEVAKSPQRNYFYGITLTFLGIIFIGGLCCGRVTKRVRRELKNR